MIVGFKTDTSFLRFLTIGAAGVRSTLSELTTAGFEPIELERYCTSNKIWTTKVKRLRLPDILCVRTGIRIEVRAKSDLRIRMSDAPENPDRRWDVGLRDDDLVGFVACAEQNGSVSAIGPPVFFTAADLRTAVGTTKHGQPKSASEGAERDREWPCTVPGSDGRILEVSAGGIRTILSSGRKQTYQLRGKHPYVAVGDSFVGQASIIAGTVSRLAPLARLRERVWDCRAALKHPDPVARYAAAKATPFRVDAPTWGKRDLILALKDESEDRVALEIAASAARLGAAAGIDFVSHTIWNHERIDLRMEAIFILTEIANGESANELLRVAGSSEFVGSEIRQAAVWGLGKKGSRSYEKLIPFIADLDEGVALHAIGAFGSDTPVAVLSTLVAQLVEGDSRRRAAASAALIGIGSDTAIEAVIRAAKQAGPEQDWVLATLGRFPSPRVRALLNGDPILGRVTPLLVLGRDENWLAIPGMASGLEFLQMQDL